MQLFENINLAVQGLKSNKIRALLTMLGIIIGIASVITIITVGNALTSAVTGELSTMGVTNIQVVITDKDNPYIIGGPGGIRNATGLKEEDRFNTDMIDKYKELYKDEIEAILLYKYIGSGKVEDGRRYANVNAYAYNEDGAKVENLEMISGRFLSDSDIQARRSVAVVSDKLVANMFNKNDNPIGKEIKLSVNDQIQSFTIIGIYKYVASSFSPPTSSEKDVTTSLYVPLTFYKQMSVNSKEGFENFIIMARSDQDVSKVSSNAEKFFNKFYKNNPNYKASTVKMETLLETVTGILGTISIAISVIAGISLLVGGIGVMNIMLVSVTERTREIGTRKALGAKNSDILAQFIVESVIICIIGGLIGVFIGIQAGNFGARIMGYDTTASLAGIVIAVVFSSFIGIFFGYYPAKKAAKLNPIDALRYE